MKTAVQGRLTDGPILNVLTKLALPIMASSFLSTAYNITDMAWIGNLGSQAVAGVGVGGMYVWLSQGLAALTRMGGQVYVAQCMGSGKREQAGNYARTAMQLVILFGVLFGAVSLLFTDQMIGFFSLQEETTIEAARIYMKITCGLILFSFVNYTLTGLFTAQGDSATPLKANTIGLVLNMIFDPVLILGVGPFPRMEVVGAAIATVGAQIVVTLVLIIEIFQEPKKAKENVRKSQRKEERQDERQEERQETDRETTGNVLRDKSLWNCPERRYYRDVVRMGLPTALQTSIYCMISMVLTRMVAAFGAGAVATQRVGGQIESISWNTADGFAAALNAFVGQNYGAGKMDRVKKGYRISFVAVALWGLLITVVFVLFPEPIARVFFHEADVIPVAVGYLIIIGFGEAFMSIELMAIGAISGLGNTRLCSIISVLLTGLRIPLAMILTRTGLALEGIWWALTLTSMLKGVVFHFAFLQQCRKVA